MKTFDDRFKSIREKAYKKKKAKALVAACTASACVLTLLLVLFVPYSNTPPSVRQYADSPYYGVIQKLNEATYEAPQYKNNFQALLAGLSVFSRKSSLKDGALMEPVDQIPETGGGVIEAGDRYQEVTDNQVAGVIEADIFKRSDEYIFHLMGNVLDIYTIAGENSAKVSRTNITELMESYVPKRMDGDSVTNAYFSPVEMYLSQNCKTVTVICDAGYVCKYPDGRSVSYQGVGLITLDVSDPGNGARLLHKQLFTGDYVSSRMVDGEILLVYRHNNYRNTVDFDDETTFIPQYGWFEDLQNIPAEDIILPEKTDNISYTVVAKLDENLELAGIKALLSYNQNVYVSQDNIFLTHSYTHSQENATGTQVRHTNMTEVTGLSYTGDALTVLGTVALEGTVLDQYSMDEYEGILRVATTTKESIYYPVTGNTSTSIRLGDGANLYCVSLADWSIAGSVLNFAPKGESVTSVRFDGAKGYVCTAELVQITDPVYFFDLSDPANITYTDTGTIDGYSTSLIQFGNGNLLGIGINDRQKLKLEIYAQGDGAVSSVCSYERPCDYSGVYKSYYVDRENQYIGLGIFDWEDGKNHYLLLHFDGQQLEVVYDHCYEDTPWGLGSYRAALIDGYLYILWLKLDVVKI